MEDQLIHGIMFLQILLAVAVCRCYYYREFSNCFDLFFL